MTKEEKEKVVAELRELIVNAPSVVLASTEGIPVNTVNELRSSLREKGVSFQVVKNTLAKRAIAGTHVEPLASKFVGSTAIAIHPEEPGVAAKVMIEFKKKVDKFEIKAGFDGHEVLDAAGVEYLANLPGRDELRAKIIGLLTAVPTKLVRIFVAAPQNMIGVLNARRDQLEGK
ncbi:MAG: 50S ribosomal protein L10 [Myxococcales bacterium]|nr:50S ribosomal protein L10 [Myxococcales bacterium]MCB9520645.1 50S ribosomal protein L10 [Myxococcales bacterium]